MLEGRVLDVWLAIRDNGAQTAHQIARRVGCHGHQVGPIIFWLMQHGWVVRLGLYHYVNARLARQMGAA